MAFSCQPFVRRRLCSCRSSERPCFLGTIDNMATANERRQELRETLWPNSEGRIWDRKKNDGFITTPRLLPLVMHLIKILAVKGDPSVAYLEIWCRVFDEGLVSVNDENAFAYAAGYSGARAARTW